MVVTTILWWPRLAAIWPRKRDLGVSTAAPKDGGTEQTTEKPTDGTPVNWFGIMGKPRVRLYEASPRHCEPITAQNPGVKCPKWSASVAQELLESAEPVGETLQATRNGIGFVAQRTRTTNDGEIWHGYPEAWDKMDAKLKKQWLDAGFVSRRDLRTYRTRGQLRDSFGGRSVGRG